MIKIYTGYYKEGIPLAIDKYPELRTMCEKEIIFFVREDLGKLDGCWVNNCLMINWGVEGKAEIIVIGKNGNEKNLKEHPMWKKWKAEMFPGEFYSCYGAEWV